VFARLEVNISLSEILRFVAGKSVMCEKPLSFNLESIKACYGLARERGLDLFCAFNKRFADGDCVLAADFARLKLDCFDQLRCCKSGPKRLPSLGFRFKTLVCVRIRLSFCSVEQHVYCIVIKTCLLLGQKFIVTMKINFCALVPYAHSTALLNLLD